MIGAVWATNAARSAICEYDATWKLRHACYQLRPSYYTGQFNLAFHQLCNNVADKQYIRKTRRTTVVLYRGIIGNTIVVSKVQDDG